MSAARILGRLQYQLARRLSPRSVNWVQELVGRNARARVVLGKLTGPVRQGTHTIARGPAKGMLMDACGSRPSYLLGTAEADIQTFLASHLRPGDTVLDLGANVGFLTLVSAAIVGPAGRVVAFEPMPGNATALRRNVELNGLTNVEVVQAAVSRAAGSASFATNGSDQRGSLVRATDDGGGTIVVDTVSVDDEVVRLGVSPALIKIDVEGAELDVLIGMRRVLDLAKPTIVCEIHEQQPTLEGRAACLLRELGYSVRWLEDEVESKQYWGPHLIAVA
jgi:FkbM family methyltransferase